MPWLQPRSFKIHKGLWLARQREDHGEDPLASDIQRLTDELKKEKRAGTEPCCWNCDELDHMRRQC